MNFVESENYLFSLGNEVSAMKLGLENIQALLADLGEPQNKYLKVQVAGTNGKGSVCAFLDSICNAAGIKTGTFTSPHLVSITERVRINGVDISENDFAHHATFVRNTAENLLERGKLEYRPTFFEQITAIALTVFADAGVELAILETGLGGRLDATTAANAEIAAITRIDIDHQEYLGETIEEIAAEKAAIIRAGSRVVIGRQSDEAMAVLQNRCLELEIAPVTYCEPIFWAVDMVKRSAVVGFRTSDEEYWDASLGLAGHHQIENACTTVLVAEKLRNDFGLAISHKDIWAGLEDAQNPGRLEFQGRYLFDGAHNIGGARVLRDFLNEFVDQPITLVFGAMKGKDVAAILELLASHAVRIVFTEPDNSRSLTFDDLLAGLPVDISRKSVFVTNNVKNAIDIAEMVTPESGIILVTGSLYLVGEVKKNIE